MGGLPRELVMVFILLHHLAIATESVLVKKMKIARLESITNDAMTLPNRERAKLARDLVASLDGPVEVSVAEAWDTEICRRINDIESGKTELLDVDEAIARARARMRS
jgi:putative addiction module component (TIGR02574 family)